MAKKMNDTIKVLMERDGLSYEEARERFEATQQDVYDAIEDMDPWEAYEYVEDILSGDLGLEMDYIFDML